MSQHKTQGEPLSSYLLDTTLASPNRLHRRHHVRCPHLRALRVWKNLLYAGRTRSGFTPRLRQDLINKFRTLETSECPFANLPEPRSGRWGAGLTAEKMSSSRWLTPLLVGRFEYVEWAPENHLRHSRFVGLPAD